MRQGANGTDHRALADRLARKADERTGENYVTEATGEGLAAVAHALLGSLPSRRSPQVWLSVRADAAASRMQVRGDRITAARVRGGDGEFTLEVFVDGFGPGGQWFVVTEGTGEWFELNADEALLTLLAETARGDEEDVPAVFLLVGAPADGKDELMVDRNY
ncbi:hypothetical protein ABZW30_23075 [Kitasatospora sp. NPDC004669]|uniref:hypothetical protein n=1 Tax=Kitasatospora sp. NPDC004669 TaxID=3154555 RepID=UPI00339DCB46